MNTQEIVDINVSGCDFEGAQRNAIRIHGCNSTGSINITDSRIRYSKLSSVTIDNCNASICSICLSDIEINNTNVFNNEMYIQAGSVSTGNIILDNIYILSSSATNLLGIKGKDESIIVNNVNGTIYTSLQNNAINYENTYYDNINVNIVRE